MLLIIDGYNVLKQAKGAQASEGEKQNFINRLVRYAHEKKHELILLFDGGYSLYPSREQVQGITVIYAGMYQSADDYIKKLLEKKQDNERMLVSSDNELCFSAHRQGIPSLDALAFWQLLLENKEEKTFSGEGALKKLTVQSDHELDALMEEVSRKVPHKYEDEEQERRPGQQKKKYEKELLKKIKKL